MKWLGTTTILVGGDYVVWVLCFHKMSYMFIVYAELVLECWEWLCMFTVYYELYSTQHGVRAFFCPVCYPLMARLIC